MAVTEKSPAQAKAELVVTHLCDAPRELVWKAWTEAERLGQWWGAKDTSLEVVFFDLRPGGTFHYRSDYNGMILWGKFVYREIVPMDKVVFVSSFADSNTSYRIILQCPYREIWAGGTIRAISAN